MSIQDPRTSSPAAADYAADSAASRGGGARPVGKITSADAEGLYVSLLNGRGLTVGQCPARTRAKGQPRCTRRVAGCGPCRKHGGHAPEVRGDRLSPATVRRVAAVLSGLMAFADRLGMITVNPCRRAQVPGRRSSGRHAAELGPDRVWDAAERARFVAGIAELPDAAVSVLAAATGMRRGELAAARWDDVDFAAGVHTVRRNVTRVRRLGGMWEYAEDTPKSGRERHVTLDPDTLGMLRALRDRLRCGPVASLAERRDHGGHILLSAAGEPMSPGQVGDAFGRHVAAVPGLRRVGGIHSVRHAHASHLLANGVPVAMVAKRLGDTVAVVEQTYAHWIRDADVRAAAVWAQVARP